MSNETIRVFTDGSCSTNPGPGGWAAVFEIDGECRVICGNDVSTTNNRMELQAVIEAYRKIVLKKTKSLNCFDSFEIHSDSAYVVNAICKGWLKNWDSCGWENSKHEPVKNRDLWQELNTLIEMARAAKITIVLKKVKGHAGNPLNEMADRIAVQDTEKAKEKRKELA
jgi:ribonuclease HI